MNELVACEDDFCFNGGTCIITRCTTSKAECRCPPGIKGRKNAKISTSVLATLVKMVQHVQIKSMATRVHVWQGTMDPTVKQISTSVLANPCQNGATCTDQVNAGYSCTCAAGYNGSNCQTNINECSSNPCQNGATCTDQVNDYSCTCAAGFNGSKCQASKFVTAVFNITRAQKLKRQLSFGDFGIDIDECDSNPCQNRGTCTDGVNGYTCRCTSSYTGINCETEYDD
ncbi:hypothetical protein QZH41_015569 [Actinostola sp. cb2023]|nr:hypothetical protein QZH41_015569 [Actinostola sp. cb2023]